MPVPIAALVGVLALASTAAAQEEISPDELLGRLAQARDLAQEDGEPSPERMADVRATLGLPADVVIGEWVVVIQPDPILEDLVGDDSADFERAAGRLDALEAALADAVAVDSPDAARMADALGAAYAGVVPPRPDPLQTIFQVFGDVFEAVIQRIGNVLGAAGNVAAWAILIAVAVVALAVLFRVRMVPDRVSSAGRAARGGAGSVDWAARADEAMRAGDLHEAVRALYLALLAALAGRGIVADAPALTAGETRFAVQRVRPALFPAIARATESYERVIYGGATPDTRDVDHLREATAQARRP
jgi:Domain of unknown function (DUF4129)